jgi:hypothetical protein
MGLRAEMVMDVLILVDMLIAAAGHGHEGLA